MTELRRVKNEATVPLSDILSATGRLPHGWAAQTEPLGVERDIDLIVELTRKAAAFLPPEQMDPWLAPRLHNAFRIPRRLAVDEGMWTWIAFQCRDFVEARFRKGKERTHPWRYRGVWSRNALSRLWWGAEMTRNGPDYSAVKSCFARTRTAQFALELMYSWDRAAAIAFSRVAEGADGGERLSDMRTKRLSTNLKVYLALRSLNSFSGEDGEGSEEFDPEWAVHTPSFGSLAKSDLTALVGPSTGIARETRIKELMVWFRQIADTTALGDLEEEIAEG